MSLPIGRGFWIWRIDKYEDGNLDKIIEKCNRANISWLAVKAGDGGSLWKQFNSTLVNKLHDNNIKVLGWSYDYPNRAEKQAQVVSDVYSIGADGFIIDAEVEWDRCTSPKKVASEYCEAIWELDLPSTFTIGDAPWDVPQAHSTFPFREFEALVSFRSPQNYWIAHGLSVKKSTERYHTSWSNFDKQIPPPRLIKPHIPSGSVWDTKIRQVTIEEVAYFESYVKFNMGLSSVCYWSWDACPSRIWSYFEGNKFDG